MLREIVIVSFSMLVAVLLGISIFAGNSTDKLTTRMVFLMVATGLAAGVITWTFVAEGETTKIIVRMVLSITFFSTVLSKLIGRIINSLTSIPQAKIQKIAIDFMRKKMSLENEKEDKNTE